MHLSSLLVVCLSGFGFATLQVKQYALKEKYEIGDSAVLYCNLTKDQEIVRSCTMIWKIWDANSNSRETISNTEKYNQRINIISKDYFSSLTIRDLTVNDTEKILCTATCFVNEKLQYMPGNWTTLAVTEKESPPWLKYLIFSINFLIFTVALGILILIVRRSRRKR